MRYILIAIMVLLTSCAYNPIVDTGGRSGTFNKDKASLITDDIQHCKKLAKNNVNSLTELYKRYFNYVVRPSFLYIPDRLEYDHVLLTRKCLSNRGHSVLN